MAGLRDVVQALLDRDGVDAVLVSSSDGLPIDHATRNGADPETLAALLPALAQSAAQLGSAANCGSLTTAILEFGERLVVLTRLTDDASLLLLAAAGADLGPVLYDLRRHGPAIAELL